MSHITCTVLLYENDFTARFMTACHRILIDLFFGNESLILIKCEFITCGKMNGCFGTGAYTNEENINLKPFTEFSRSNHDGTEWKRSSM